MSATNQLPPVSSGSLVVTPELQRRIEGVERVMIADFGLLHVPDAQESLRYFRNESDARVERRREAERRVRQYDYRREQLEQRLEANRQATLAAMEQRGPTPRECAERQRAEYEATGLLLSTGYEA